MFNYLQFWFAASNEHGIHSPFVFNLLTRGLYPKDSRWRGLSIKDQFLPRMWAYFTPKHVATLNGSTSVMGAVAVSVVSYEPKVGGAYDAILFQGQNAHTWPQVETVAQTMHNDSFWVIDRRSQEVSIEKYWQEVVASDEMIVTLDFYYFGVALKRKEQLKQHFKLRLQPDRVFRLLRV